MGYRQFLGCGHKTGLNTESCPVCNKVDKYIDCTCGSGGHPRYCQIHPDSYQKHIDELNSEEEI